MSGEIDAVKFDRRTLVVAESLKQYAARLPKAPDSLQARRAGCGKESGYDHGARRRASTSKALLRALRWL